MKQKKEHDYYDQIKDWNFDMFEIETESLTNWELEDELAKIVTSESKVLDLGTGGGEKVLKFPPCKEILGTDFSEEMIKTAKRNLKEFGRDDVTFRIMDNLKMDVEDNYYDVVVARHTIIDPKQIIRCLKPGGYLLVRGVDQYDCHSLKLVFGRGQAHKDSKPISIIDYENILNAGFSDVELIPIFEREYFKNRFLFKEFLKKVPIIDDFSEIEESHKDFYSRDLEDDKLDEYISNNTENGKIKLLRRYYGIVARKK